MQGKFLFSGFRKELSLHDRFIAAEQEHSNHYVLIHTLVVSSSHCSVLQFINMGKSKLPCHQHEIDLSAPPSVKLELILDIHNICRIQHWNGHVKFINNEIQLYKKTIMRLRSTLLITVTKLLLNYTAKGFNTSRFEGLRLRRKSK